MRIQYGMSHRGRQPVELGLAQAVLGPLGRFVHAIDRHAQFVGEVELPQAMRAQDVQRNTLALGRELKLRPFRADQALAFEALRQRHQLAIAHAQRALQRSERGGMAVGGLPQQVLEGVLGPLARLREAVLPDRRDRAILGREHRQSNRDEKEEVNRQF